MAASPIDKDPAVLDYLRQKDVAGLINDAVAEMIAARPDDARAFLHEYFTRPQGATVACKCGGVVLRFANPKPTYVARCCCVDCAQKCKWCEEHGGPKVPQGVADRKETPLLVYLHNRFTVEKGKESIACNVLREGATSTNFIASCCHTLLFVDHPVYAGNSVLVFPEVATWTGLEKKDPQIYWWVKDWDPEAYTKLEPKLPGAYIDHTQPADKQPAWTTTTVGTLDTGDAPDGMGMGAFMAMVGVPPPAGPGIQAKDLPCAASPTTLGLPQGAQAYNQKVAAASK